MKHLRRYIGIISVAILGVYAVSFLPGSTQKVLAAPATFTVTNVNDSGAGSLRAAITSSNSNGNPADQDVINFNISGTGAHTISVLSPISITQAVLINGYSQPTAAANTAVFPEPLNGILRIELKFTSNLDRVSITSNNVEFRGLALYDEFDVAPKNLITATSSDNFRLSGSYIGTNYAGIDSAYPNDDNRDAVSIIDSDSVIIGGTNPSDRNVFGSCALTCLSVTTDSSTSDNIVVQGNYFKLGADGISPFYDSLATPSRGIYLGSGVTDPKIGGTTTGSGNFFNFLAQGTMMATNVDGLEFKGNLIYKSQQWSIDSTYYGAQVVLQGVTNAEIGSVGSGKNEFGGGIQSAIGIHDSEIDGTLSSNIAVSGNVFGYNHDESEEFANDREGIAVWGSSHDISIDSNKIHNATNGAGVSINDDAQRVSVTSNSIYNNRNFQGIDNGRNNSVAANDAFDTDSGANGGLNSPGYTLIAEDGGNTDVDFIIDVPAGEYRIEFFSNTVNNLPGQDEGETYLGFANITSAGTGLEEFSHTLNGTGHTNMSLTATEINNSTQSGYGATSEFGSEGAANLPFADLSAVTSLTNPNDLGAVGDTANITVTITNSGPNPFDLSTLSSTSPSSNFLFTTLLPPELNYGNISGSGIACNDLGPGSASGFGTDFGNHTGYGVLTCGYTGGSGTLASGQSRTFTISATVMTPRAGGFQVFTILNAPETDQDHEDYTTVIESGTDYIDGFAALNGSVDNYSVITFSHTYVSDLSVSKSLLNAEDYATGNILNYRITVTNNGYDPLDLNLYDTPTPGQDNILLDILPAQLAFSAISGTGIACSDFGPNSAGFFGPVLGNHSDHSVIVCASNGNSPILDSGESISYTLSAEVLDDSEPIFYNHVFVNVNYGDPDGPAVSVIAGGGSELLDGMQAQGINNYAAAYSQPANASVTKTLDNPEDVAVGATLNYTLTFTNNGPFSIDPTVFDGSGVNPTLKAIFTDILPPNLSYVSQSNPDLSCFWAGPGSASFAGPIFGNHSDYSLVICTYTGSVTDLANGESISTTITTTADTVPNSFTNYLISPGPSIDPDNNFMNRQLSGTGNYEDGDALDNILASEANNAVLAAYTSPPSEETQPSDSGTGNSSNNGGSSSGNGGLNVTGQQAWTVAAATSLVVSLLVLIWLKRPRRNS